MTTLFTHVANINNSLALIKSIQPVTYYYKDEYMKKGVNVATGRQYGFIANDLETIVPELVIPMYSPNFIDPKDEYSTESVEKVEYKGINYIGIIPILTKAIQEQQTLIENQQMEINQLKIQQEEILNKIEELEMRIKN
nr:tail fiber domain-containing protein [Bacteroidota bacterium]